MVMPQFEMNIRTQGLDEAIRVSKSINPAFTGAVLNDGLRSIGRLFVPSKGTGPLAQ